MGELQAQVTHTLLRSNPAFKVLPIATLPAANTLADDSNEE